MRLLHYAERTEEAYVDWICRFIHFQNKRHPRDMGGVQDRDLSDPPGGRQNVAANTAHILLGELKNRIDNVADFELTPDGTILDGELVGVPNRRPDFRALMARHRVLAHYLHPASL